MGVLRRWASGLPGWVWPIGLVTSGAVLVWQGRLVVSGVLAAVALGFGLCLVLLMVWALVGLASPGRHVAVDGPLAVVAHLRDRAGDRAGQARMLVGRAPWRGPEAVLSAVAEQVCDEVAALPSGPAAVRTVEVHLHPDTIAVLDGWMPIEDVARHWARAYAARHARLPSDAGKVSVLVVDAPSVPVNRARVTSRFRAPEHPDARALASAPLTGPQVDPARGMHTALRVHDAQGQAAAQRRVDPKPVGPSPVGPQDKPLGRTRLEPGQTQRMDRADSARSSDRPGAQDADGEGTQVLGHDGEPRPAAPRCDGLALLPVHPSGATPTGEASLSVRAPRATLGRATGQTVRLSNAHVSRRHAEIKRLASGWVIIDQHSTYGTYVNGHPLRPLIPHPLTIGDLLEIGRPEGGGSPTAYRVTGQAPARAA